MPTAWSDALGLVEVVGQHDAVGRQLVAELRLQARALERLQERRRLGGDRPLVDRPCDEDVLQRDHLGLHADDLGDLRHAAGAVDEPRQVDDHVECAGDLLAHRVEREVDPRHQHHRLETRERVTRRVGVDRGQRALVARVHRLEHVQRLGAANLADDDPVRPHAQRVADELADPHLALALDVRRAGLEADPVLLLELELGCVLDRDDALRLGDEGRQRVQRSWSCRCPYHPR